MIAYRSLVKWALSKGYRVVVWDGEEWAVKVGSGDKFQKIIDAIKSVDESELVVVEVVAGPPREGRAYLTRRVGWAQVICPGPGWVSDEESVADYAPADGEINDWFEEFYKQTA